MAQLIIAAVAVDKRSESDVARTYEVSRRWVITRIQRYEADGAAGLGPRPRRPQRTSIDVEDEIVAIRRERSGDGHDAGVATIAYHLERRHGDAPSLSTI